MRHSVAIVAIARNEGRYINEWIEYHHSLGFDHIYIYDNSFGNEERLSRSISRQNMKVVSIVPAYNRHAFQKQAYGLAYNKFGKMHDYLLFIDIDEFFTLNMHKDISDYIQFLDSRCPGFQNARIHWEIYDDNNAIERDMSVPVHEFFTQLSTTKDAMRHNNATKSLVKTMIGGLYFPNVHFPKTRTNGQLVVCDSMGVQIHHPCNQFIEPRNVSVAKIRHYVTKTISEYMNQKLCRGDADGYIVRDIWNRFFNYCTETPQKMKYYEEHRNEVYDGKYAGFTGISPNVTNIRRNDKIVVAMTSWRRRINNCKNIVCNVMNQTLKPNLLFLTLSLEEFPGRERDLPQDLVQLAKVYPRFKINWVQGNDKSFKKVFPILPYLDDDDIIMLTDDDYDLEETTIQSRYREFNLANRKCVITSDWMDCGQTMMFQKKMLNGYEKFFVPRVIRTGNDDAVYFNLFHLNGYRTRRGSSALLSNSKRFIKDQYGLTDNHLYLDPPEVTKVMIDILGLKSSNVKWDNLFGMFRLGHNNVSMSGHSEWIDSDFMEGRLSGTFSEAVQKFFYGDNLDGSDDANILLFVGSDIPNQMGKNTMCCGLGWKYLPGQKYREFRQLVPPQNFCYFRGDISRRQVAMEGVNLRKNIPVGDTRLLSSLIWGEQKPSPSMDIGIVVGPNMKQTDDYVKIAKEKFPDREIGFIETCDIGFEELAEFVSDCRMIISNSLWGIAVAHSFGVQALCFLDSSGFEFMDYYSVFKRIKYRQLTRKIAYQTALEMATDGRFVDSVNTTREEVQAVQRNIIQAFPYRDRMIWNGEV